MSKKIKNIFNLTKIFFKSSFQNLYIINNETKKLNKKSIFVWLIIAIMIAISYISFEIIKILVSINQSIIFINIFLIILMIIMIFQVILSSANVYFFSKDLEILLPFPIKSEELLISKFCTILVNIYFTELIVALLPLIIYGILLHVGLFYYFYIILILFLFPILPTLFVSVIMMFLIKLSKFIKNKDSFQVIITLTFIFLMFLLEFLVTSNLINRIDDNFNIGNVDTQQQIENYNYKIENINKVFLEINPTVNIIKNYNKPISTFYLFEIIIINVLFLFLFIMVGKKVYLKNILKSNNNFYLRKSNNKILEKTLKKRSLMCTYIKKEFKILFKTPIFFMQSIFPILIVFVSICIISVVAIPNIKAILSSDIFGQDTEVSVNLGIICAIVGTIQIMCTISNISITSISREGKGAFYMKFLPIDWYKQIIYKSTPQIVINSVLITFILVLAKLIFIKLQIIHLLLIFIISNIINIISSELMVVVDLNKPNLKWNADYEAIKQNNKLFQYVLTILIILILVYFNKIFSDVELNIACSAIIIILLILMFIINKVIRINVKKMYKKIN